MDRRWYSARELTPAAGRNQCPSKGPFGYLISGLRVASELELPEFAPGTSSPERVDVSIRYGSVARPYGGARRSDDWVQFDGQRTLVRIDGLARYVVEGGTRIVVDPAAAAPCKDVRLHLFSTVWAAMLVQRELLPLHASAIVTGSGAVAFAGPSGAGKSTMLAAMGRRGYPVLADDVSVVRTGAADRTVVLPYVQRIKLRPDSLRAVDATPYGRESEQSEDAKWLVAPEISASPFVSYPLRRIYLLAANLEGGPVSIARRAGRSAVQTLIENTYRPFMIEPLGKRSQHFRACVSVARDVDVFALSGQRRLRELESLVDLVEDHMLHD